jgi:hypothetical protein
MSSNSGDTMLISDKGNGRENIGMCPPNSRIPFPEFQVQEGNHNEETMQAA